LWPQKPALNGNAKNLAHRGSALVGAAIAVAFAVAYLSDTLLGIPRAAIRTDAIGLAGLLTVFVVTNLFMRWHDRR
jgi:precorrin-3B methylase